MNAGHGNEAFVAFEHVQKSYDGETLVVKDLNLKIGQGEFLTMLGPSGSGKTTCLMMLAGLETATHGEIRRGDELVQVRIEIPKKLNKTQEDLLREFVKTEDKSVLPESKGFFDKLVDYLSGADE